MVRSPDEGLSPPGERAKSEEQWVMLSEFLGVRVPLLCPDDLLEVLHWEC